MARSEGILLATLLVTSCGGDVASEMERSLVATNEAIALSLTATDVLWYAYAEAPPDPTTGPDTLRHGTSGPCPRLEHDETDAPEWPARVDYGDGCVPRSGLLPVVVSGHGILDRSGDEATTTLDGLALHLAYGISGTGTARGDVGGFDLTATMVVSSGEGDVNADLDLRVDLEGTGVRIDGQVDLSDDGGRARMRLADVHLPWGSISGECPTPNGGRSTLRADTDVSMGFDRPGDGRVIVHRGQRESELVELCAYEAWFFGGRRPR